MKTKRCAIDEPLSITIIILATIQVTGYCLAMRAARYLTCSFIAALLCACASDPVARRGSRASFDLPTICQSAQVITSGTTLASIVVMHTGYDAFVKSKPTVRPLELEQYVWYADETHEQPKMVSCKMKTADHINAEYGANAAGAEASCAMVNQRIYASVLRGLSSTERHSLRFGHGRGVVFDTDIVTNDGPVWVRPFAMIYVDSAGLLHIQSKGMRNDWQDQRYLNAPVRFRGTRYCHLVAPIYLHRVLTGDVAPDPSP